MKRESSDVFYSLTFKSFKDTYEEEEEVWEIFLVAAAGVCGEILAIRRRQASHSSASGAELAARMRLLLVRFLQVMLDIWNACGLPSADSGPIISTKVPVRKKDPSNQSHNTFNIAECM